MATNFFSYAQEQARKARESKSTSLEELVLAECDKEEAYDAATMAEISDMASRVFGVPVYGGFMEDPEMTYGGFKRQLKGCLTQRKEERASEGRSDRPAWVEELLAALTGGRSQLP